LITTINNHKAVHFLLLHFVT